MEQIVEAINGLQTSIVLIGGLIILAIYLTRK